jgi:hypothetical protein
MWEGEPFANKNLIEKRWTLKTLLRGMIKFKVHHSKISSPNKNIEK